MLAQLSVTRSQRQREKYIYFDNISNYISIITETAGDVEGEAEDEAVCYSSDQWWTSSLSPLVQQLQTILLDCHHIAPIIH